MGRGLLTGSVDLHEAIEARIPHLGQPQTVPLLAFRIGLFTGQQAEEGTLADLRKTYQTEFHRIFFSLLPFNKTSPLLFEDTVLPKESLNESRE